MASSANAKLPGATSSFGPRWTSPTTSRCPSSLSTSAHAASVKNCSSPNASGSGAFALQPGAAVMDTIWRAIPSIERTPALDGAADGLGDFAAEDLQREERLVDETSCLGAVFEDVRSGLLRLDRELVNRIDLALDDPLRAVVRALHAHDGPAVLPHLRHEAADHSSSQPGVVRGLVDRKSTRLNSSHGSISYAVFCLK